MVWPGQCALALMDGGLEFTPSGSGRGTSQFGEVHAGPAEDEAGLGLDRPARQDNLVLLGCGGAENRGVTLEHRSTRTEQASGRRESAIHAVMMAEISVPLLRRVNPLLLGSARLRPC